MNAFNIDRLLADPSGQIYAASAALLSRFSDKQTARVIESLIGRAPSYLGHAVSGAWTGTQSVSGAIAYFGEAVNRGREQGRRNAIRALMQSYTLTRAVVALSEQEKSLIRGMAALLGDSRLSQANFDAFLADIAWGGGQTTISAPGTVASHPQEAVARQILTQVLQQLLPPYAQVLASTAKRLADERGNGRASGAAIARLLSPGGAWGQAEGATFSHSPTPASLVIGYEDGRPVYFSGNESLITIAGPGTGKSQAQVIRNLLTYPGSAFVLDVKGELWAATAARRQARFGPVYRFAPTDPYGETHAYNPFDFVSRDPAQAAVDCELIAAQIIPPNTESKDPFWDNRGRDFLWTFAVMTALAEPPERRNLATVMERLAIPVNFLDGTRDAAYLASPTPAVIAQLKALAEEHRIPALAQNAVAVESGLNDRTDGVFDAARRHLTIFSRSHALRAAMSRSDWSPLTLRQRPGATVYLCLSGDDIDTYTPIVRLILQQHANILLKTPPTPGAPPVTFFLDEFPQLGRMESVQRLIDVGRGAALRLWLFAQYIGQLRDAYGRRADGLINACRVRCFMQPDNEAAEFLGPQLGHTAHLFSGERRPLAEPHALMGAAFADKIIVTARGHDPLQLHKCFAYEDMARLMAPPPRLQSRR
ncbi:MAG: type IV secretory system conjugative DNA transfer family protein [Hyphomicrobiales bacterium]|nr:type IV secretory system conjugative DNA transfer family protein [Hyphomicrobiales bacterium]